MYLAQTNKQFYHHFRKNNSAFGFYHLLLCFISNCHLDNCGCLQHQYKAKIQAKSFYKSQAKSCFYETHFEPWSFQLLSCSPSTTGLALQFTIVCHNSDNLYKAFIVQIEAFLILIELSNNFLWEISQIFYFDKARPCIKAAFLY